MASPEETDIDLANLGDDAVYQALMARIKDNAATDEQIEAAHIEADRRTNAVYEAIGSEQSE